MKLTCRVILHLAGLVLVSACAGVASAQSDDAEIQVHEWSVWVVDATLDQANQAGQYPSLMPAQVESDRSRAGERQGKFPPLAVIFLHGQEVADAEVDLRISSGRFLSFWPPAEKKNNRVRWLELALSAGPVAETRFAEVDQAHWFTAARQVDALHVSHAARLERFLAYDAELALASPVKLAGGPDTYHVDNVASFPLLDVLVIVPGPDGTRVGRLENLPAAGGPAAVTSTSPAAAVPPQGQPGAAVPATPAQAAADAVKAVAEAVIKAAKESPNDAKVVLETPPTNAPTNTPAPAAPSAEPAGVEVFMSPAFAADSTEAAAARQSILDMLIKSGLTRPEADLFGTIYGESLVSPSELVVLARMPIDALEVRLPLVVYPTPTRTVRTALVIVRNIDPRIRGEVVELVAALGADEYSKREQSDKRLRELGRLAVPALKEALKNPDVEVAFRAERILLAANETIE